MNLVSDVNLHKPGSIYKLIIRHIRQKHPNIAHVIKIVEKSVILSRFISPIIVRLYRDFFIEKIAVKSLKIAIV